MRINATAFLIWTLFVKAVKNASAHYLLFEEQAREEKPWRDTEGDSSFSNPMYPGHEILDAQAIFAYLHEDDVDVFKYNITQDDFAHAREFLRTPFPFVFASALPPACKQTKNNYPAAALLVPFGTAMGMEQPAHTFDYLPPLDVPLGYGVIPALNPPVHGNEERAIFDLDAMGGDLGLSWFLPTGCTVDNGIPNCTNSNALAVPVLFNVPSIEVYIVVWDPDGTPQDYTLSVGLDDWNNTWSDPEIQELIRNNAYLHTPCSEPYDD